MISTFSVLNVLFSRFAGLWRTALLVGLDGFRVLRASCERVFVRIMESAILAEVTETAMWHCATPDGDEYPNILTYPPTIAVLLFDQTGGLRVERTGSIPF